MIQLSNYQISKVSNCIKDILQDTRDDTSPTTKSGKYRNRKPKFPNCANATILWTLNGIFTLNHKKIENSSS